MGRNTARAIMTLAGIAILVGFFMPWFDFGGVEDGSGFELLREADVSAAWLAVLLAVPASGLLLAAAGLSGIRFGRYLALLVGALIMGYGAYRFFQLFFSVTGPGIWLVVTGGLIALTVGLMPERGGATAAPPERATSVPRVRARTPNPPSVSGADETKPL